jgi:tRNA pseudouridine55 synthase
VRSIAHDLGQRAGCGAHLTALVRTRSGDFQLDAARTLDQMQALASTGRLVEALIPLEEMLPQFPVERVDDLTASQIRHGREFRVSPFRPQPAAPFVKAVGTDGKLICIGEQTMPNVYHPMLVL